MSFFQRYNNNAPRAMYKKMSEIALFLPMEMILIKKSVTQIGESTQINATSTDGEIFFYLNSRDHAKFMDADYVFLSEEIKQGRKPIVFVARTKDGLTTCIVPTSEYVKQY